MPQFVDLSGFRFGRISVLGRAPDMKYPSGQHQSAWFCRCDCGTEKIIHGPSMRRGATKSCGCLFIEGLNARMKHGHSKNTASRSREYRSWGMMKQRCLNSKNKKYPSYGGRGITICERWMDFRNFLADMGPCPLEQQIDRINNNGNYEPGNCRWATRSEQQCNTRRNRFIDFNGQTFTVTEWSRKLGFKRGTIEARLLRGWSVERAFSTR